MPQPVSLDEIMSERGFSAGVSKSGKDMLTKVRAFAAPKSWDGKSRSCRFIMTAEVVDRYGDIVVAKGADTTEFMNNPVALWAHNSRNFPIGLWSDLKNITGSPKRIEGLVTLNAEGSTPEADTCATLINEGVLRACSIGFIPKAWEAIKDEKDRFVGYKFVEWELLECSICSIPANPAAIAKAAGGDTHLALQAIELVLDEWARTPDGLIVPRSEYERTHQILKDKEVTLHEVRSIEDEAAPAVELNQLDIEAAVSAGIVKALSGEGVIDAIKKFLGITPKEVVPDPEPVAVIEQAVEEDEGETEAEFQARVAAETKVEDDLADEQEELAARARAAELA